ncbi:MAG TPA: hydrolase [Lapillicoccus sp.]|uniref:hydrolase n=1 Tax=Lapillicoccus sp. TaxID=1909287 RepID=UPI002F941112
MTITAIDPHTALVLIDLQGGILGAPTQPYSAAEVLDRAVRLADGFRGRGLPVVLVRVTARADGADVTPGRTETPRPAGRPEGWDVLADELTGHEDDIVVTKRNWGAFHGTDLDVQLRRRGVTQIVLGGIATSMGVESTARAAHEHGYHVTLATDAMADRSADMHQHSIENVFPRLGETGTTDEILALLETTPAVS